MAGVVYTASQDVAALQQLLPRDIMTMVGHVSVKFDPRSPANSMVVCEEWSGLAAAGRDRHSWRPRSGSLIQHWPCCIMTELRRILYPLTAALILGYFLFFSWKSLHMYFDNDDMYALYFAWSKPLGQVVRENLFFWKGEFRPLGAFFYRGIFAAAGFNPLPFRIAALGVCLLNTSICFWFTRLISASERTAALATLLFAFQARMLEVWFRTTVIFDSLCFLFVLLATGIYIKARRNGGDLNGWRIAAILLAFICALDSKEFGVCLPVFLVAWEVIVQRIVRAQG